MPPSTRRNNPFVTGLLFKNLQIETEEMKSAKKDIEDIAQPIIASVYQKQQQSSNNSQMNDEL